MKLELPSRPNNSPNNAIGIAKGLAAFLTFYALLSPVATYASAFPDNGVINNTEASSSVPLQAVPFDPNSFAETSLPVDSIIDTEANRPFAVPPLPNADVVKSPKIISGVVADWEGPLTLDGMVNHLVDSTFFHLPEGQLLDKQVRHLSGAPAKIAAATKDGFQHAFEYQGFEPSERAGKLILDEKYKVRNIAWAEYDRQKFVDKIHAQVVASMMQVAEGSGMKDTTHGAALIASAKTSLEQLVGEDEAQKAIVGMTAWLSHVDVAESTFEQSPWNTIERNAKLEEVVREALKQDPVVKAVTAKLNKYTHPGKLKSGAAHVVDTSLNGIALLAPGFAIPLSAEVLETGWKVSTGGTEENKLERELLLDKRIQSRLKVFSQEASLALDNYRFAQVTHNPELLSFSQEVLSNMTGREYLPKIVSAPSTSDSNIVPAISESKPSTATGAAALVQKGQTVLKQLAPLTSL